MKLSKVVVPPGDWMSTQYACNDARHMWSFGTVLNTAKKKLPTRSRANNLKKKKKCYLVVIYIGLLRILLTTV